MIERAVIGDSSRRLQDARFGTGHGAYLSDCRGPGITHAVFLRSPDAHAWSNVIDTGAAMNPSGVIAILTAKDVAGDGTTLNGPASASRVWHAMRD